MWLGEGKALPLWTPEADEPPPPGTVNLSPSEFPDEFSGTLTVELVPGVLDHWDEGAFGFGALFTSDAQKTAMDGGMGYTLHRREGNEGLSYRGVIAEWKPVLSDD